MPTTTPIYNFNDVWTNGLTNACIKAVITDTSSAADSKMIDLEVTGKGAFTVDKNGNLETSGLITGKGAFTMISCQENAVAEPTVDATPRKITAFDTDGLNNSMTPDESTDTLTAVVAGVYAVSAQISFSGSINSTYHIVIYKNTGSTGFEGHRKLGTGGDVGSCSVMGFVELDIGDTISLYQYTDDGSIMTVDDAQLMAHRVSA